MRKARWISTVVALAAAFAVPVAHADYYSPGDAYSPGANAGWTSVRPHGSSWSRLRPNPSGWRSSSLATFG